ncbi:MAG: dTDP-4-dehydrorhamnose reductase [Planctomycetota bacterium]
MPGSVSVIGASGMVGRSWMGLLRSHGIPARGLIRPEIDLDRPESLSGAVLEGDELVVCAAAWTDVDAAESDEAGATRANAEAVRILGDRCREIGATLIHYSTDYVFDGRGSEPYPIDAPINPVNAYGRSKAAGERSLRDTDCAHLILRTSWVYAPWGNNFVRTIAGLAETRDELRVVDDQRGRPTSAEELARSSLALYLAGAAGTWHVTDGGDCTWHDLATEVVAALGLRCAVTPCGSDEYPRPAVRPGYSVLDIGSTEATIGPRTDWRTSVRRAVERMDRGNA